MSLKIAISVGEHSGDIHGSNLVKEILSLSPSTNFFGMGGENLEKCGVQIDFNMKEVSVVGVSEVITKLPKIYTVFKKFSSLLKKEKPDVLITIDFPDFNFKLIKEAKKLNIPVVYYITPQVWAWRKGRIKFLKEKVDLALNILPFEEPFFKEYGIKSFYVGHPLLDIEQKILTKEEFEDIFKPEKNKIFVAMLPGSRNSEVKSHLKTLVETAQILNTKRKDLIFITPKANNVSKKIWNLKCPENFFLLENLYYETLTYSDIALVASGTASLECALNGIPSVVFYYLNPFTYFLGKKLVKLPFVSLPNIILDREAFKELIQKDFSAESCALSLEEILRNLNEKKEKHLKIKSELTQKLGNKGASKRAAQKILDVLKNINKLS